MLLGVLGVSLLGNTLAGKGINKTGEVIVTAGYGTGRSSIKKKIIIIKIAPHPSTTFEMQK